MTDWKYFEIITDSSSSSGSARYSNSFGSNFGATRFKQFTTAVTPSRCKFLVVRPCKKSFTRIIPESIRISNRTRGYANKSIIHSSEFFSSFLCISIAISSRVQSALRACRDKINSRSLLIIFQRDIPLETIEQKPEIQCNSRH